MISLLFIIQSVLGWVPVVEINTTAHDFKVDQLRQIYLIHENFIEKYNSEGKLLFRTSDPGYGKIGTLCVNDPMKPFLFFRDQGIIYPMDNTQSLQGGVLELAKTGMLVTTVGWSRDNHYWLWDSYRSELVRVDRGLNRVNATGNLQSLLGITLNPIQIEEVGGYWVYLVDPDLGLFVFDVYGNYYNQKSILAPNGIQIHENFILYSDEKEIHFLDKSLVSETTIPLPSASICSVQRHGELYYLLGNGKFVAGNLTID